MSFSMIKVFGLCLEDLLVSTGGHRRLICPKSLYRVPCEEHLLSPASAFQTRSIK